MKNVNIVNLLGYTVNIYNQKDCSKINNEFQILSDVTTPLATFNSCGIIPKVYKEFIQIGKANNIGVYKIKYSDIVDLPMERDGIKYIVNEDIAAAVKYMAESKKRKDLIIPNGKVYNKNNKFIGYINFIQI